MAGAEYEEDDEDGDQIDLDEVRRSYYANLIEMLAIVGWKAEVTRSTDNGEGELLAEGHGCQMVVRADIINRPIGVITVREIAAARDNAGADFAVILSSSELTSAARTAALKSDVFVIAIEDLENLNDELGIS